MEYKVEIKDEQTWSVTDDTGIDKEIVFFDESMYVTDGNKVIVAKDEDELDRVLSGNLLAKEDDRCEEYYIGGYRVLNAKPYEEVVVEGVDLPLYRKRANSEVIYAAGFYCVRYETGWKHGTSIMLSTLENYDYRGPFHTMNKAYSSLLEVRKKR